MGKIPAFFAPSSATVATGTPDGICNIDNIESQPSSELLDLIKHPVTGNGVKLFFKIKKNVINPAPALLQINLSLLKT